MMEREKQFKKFNKEILDNSKIDCDMPFYGFYRYRYKNSDPLDTYSVRMIDILKSKGSDSKNI